MTLEIHVMTKDRHIYVAQLNRFMGSRPDRRTQLVTHRLLSTHHTWVNWYRNPHCHVIVLKHVDKS